MVINREACTDSVLEQDAEDNMEILLLLRDMAGVFSSRHEGEA